METFSYVRPATTQQALAAFAQAGAGARFVAGGTTLYDLMKLQVERPAHLIDVTAIQGLNTIDVNFSRLRFGSQVPMAVAATHPVVTTLYPVLAESLQMAASQQLRNMATLGGNLLQRTRCMYFRNGADGTYPCNKRNPGSGCPAIDGLNREQAVLGVSTSCNAVSPGDWPVALTAMDATIEVIGPAGTRRIPIAQLYLLPGSTPQLEFSLQPGELITAIEVPTTLMGRVSTYHKIRDRESFAFALASAAVALDLRGNHVAAVRIAIGGVATVPWRATAAEQALTGQTLTSASAYSAGLAAFQSATPGAHNGFKIELGARTIADALMIAAKRS